MRIFQRYQEFVAGQIKDLPRGSRSRGWTVLGLWSMLLLPLAVVGFAVAYFLGLYSFLVFMAVLVLIEIVFRIVEMLSN